MNKQYSTHIEKAQIKQITELKSQLESKDQTIDRMAGRMQEMAKELETKDKEIEELRKVIDNKQIRFKLDEPESNRALESKNIELESQLKETKTEMERFRDIKDEAQYLIKFSTINGDIINGSMTRESVLNLKSLSTKDKIK